MKVKEVDVRTLAGHESSNFIKDFSSLTMVHVWSLGKENKASLSLISWAPDSKKRGIKERKRINLLEGLIKFLGMFRRAADIKV